MAASHDNGEQNNKAGNCYNIHECFLDNARDRYNTTCEIVLGGALESAGWKAGSGTAIHPDNAQGRFYRRLLEESAPIGEARVYEYLFNDRTVAMNLCLFHAGVLIVLKTTYDESIRALSPASLLRAEELQALFASHEVQRIEYFGRVMDWHTKLTESRRTLYHLTCYRWQWVARLAQRRRQARANGTSTPIAAAAAGE